ncbi:hypothetical protein SARC_12281 [Sphaeroforma arctica JP610]|uniref:HD domain-containing protein n=1 Tax=Sphaeroforma arctica JP610 TaxID=667725 RepID=A0A0L0FEJ5_9EUKA|nr:hypothetical protein SARC_12281 [Sphaeroforma arctica JP610]KNC75187.1 hypothetical protein SARC_12281 [Sphaeroforma arctica JP610]|eukprot:XP_014149089.1 hypothetical protein SARC_12281 [Sphaeroforma arctica JP610]
MALRIGAGEGFSTEQMQTAEISALLHDVDDWKYNPEDNGLLSRARTFLTQHDFPTTDAVLQIIQSMGFKESLGSAKLSDAHTPELSVVQDADRLDAIGAIGVARCLTFGGRFNRVLYDPQVPPRINMTKEQYQDTTVQQTTINHFHEKLFLLKDMMKTKTGRRIADERDGFMHTFLDQFLGEMNGDR